MGTVGHVWTGSRILAWWSLPEPAAAPYSGSAVLCWMHGRRKTNVALLAAPFIAGFLLIPQAWPILAVLGILSLFAYAFPATATALLPIALIWSPKFYLTQSSGESFFLQADHPLLLGIAIHLTSTGRWRDTPLYTPLSLFLIATGLSVLAALAGGAIPAPELAFAYWLQLVRLTLVFAAAYSLGPRMGEAGLRIWLLTIISLAAYGICEARSPLELAHGYRTFERGLFDGQANHMAGCLVLGAAMGVALLCEPRWRVLGLSTALLALAALPGTRSREAVAGLAAAAIVLCLARRQWAPSTYMALLLAALLAMFVFGGSMWYRLAVPGGSLYDRLVHWKSAMSTVRAHPFLGLGLGTRHRQFYDSQYVMLFAETGAAGVLCFLGWLLCLTRSLWQACRESGLRGTLCLGALAGLAAVAVQGLAAVSFIVTVLAGTLYWAVGFALSYEREPEL